MDPQDGTKVHDDDRSRDPLELFEAWFDQARSADVPLCHAVCLATVSEAGTPSARMVLFQGVADGRLRFFTDYRSRKARELTRNPAAAMVFHWQALDRQVRVEGQVDRLSGEASDEYFGTRPRGSRISAWASTQSAEVDSRRALERAWSDVEARFDGRDVSRPDHWGGYGLAPDRFEFWQGRDNRLHDRLVFTRGHHGWSSTRLQP
jgi:pyridoxamine 5'-phosphate oxidase